ncbi:MAG TPA: NTPase [Dehalococcoidia bacterium]|nr:NTPase [Dehalococcoidia bacterium]
MNQAYLLSGAPGVGKTTIIKQAIDTVKEKTGGFYTREIRSHGVRQGFEIVTLDGQSAILAHINIHSPYRVSKYGVDTENLDKIGVSALRRAIQECDIVVIDEIGKMELFSLAFREAVLEAIGSGKRLLGTIMLAHHPWADQIKQDPRVKVLTVSRTNYHQILEEFTAWLGNK